MFPNRIEGSVFINTAVKRLTLLSLESSSEKLEHLKSERFVSQVCAGKICLFSTDSIIIRFCRLEDDFVNVLHPREGINVLERVLLP